MSSAAAEMIHPMSFDGLVFPTNFVFLTKPASVEEEPVL